VLRHVLAIGPFIGVISLGVAILAVDGSRGWGAAAQVAPTSTATQTVTPNSASIALTVTPAEIVCDGFNSSTVTAHVTDAAGDSVVDGTPVSFQVDAFGTSNPQDTHTINGEASSIVTSRDGAAAAGGITLVVMSGKARSSIRIACASSVTSTATPSPVETALTAPAPSGSPAPNLIAPATGDGTSSTTDDGVWRLMVVAWVGGALTVGGLAMRRVGVD
jgi:S-DNA-T family DNA segregation ATPase FtsK/SpoIIIE